LALSLQYHGRCLRRRIAFDALHIRTLLTTLPLTLPWRWAGRAADANPRA